VKAPNLDIDPPGPKPAQPLCHKCRDVGCESCVDDNEPEREYEEWREGHGGW
jgi:hypothetical protein